MSYKASVVIPIYNKELLIKTCLDSLINQTCGIDNIQVICVNDGSTDRSLDIVLEYCERYPTIQCINQPNAGVAVARNNGIKCAKARYIFFLDADDTLSKNTIDDVVNFFDEIYNETDIVTYPLYYNFGEGILVKNKRGNDIRNNQLLKISDYPHLAQTTMNFCIKNHDGLPLFVEGQHVYEDQIFNLRRVLNKKSIGWCATAKYFYRKDTAGLSQLDHPFYTFDLFIDTFNQMLDFCCNDDDKLQYVSHLILFSIGWRLIADRFFPYHLKGEQQLVAKEKIRNLISRLSNKAIVTSPWLSSDHKFFLLKLKYSELHIASNGVFWSISDNSGVLVCHSQISITIYSEKILNNHFYIKGYLHAPILNFVDKPELKIIVDGVEKSIPVFPSKASLIGSHYVANKYWRFESQFPVKPGSVISFKVRLADQNYKTNLKFKSWLPHSSNNKFIRDNTAVLNCGTFFKIVHYTLRSKIIDIARLALKNRFALKWKSISCSLSVCKTLFPKIEIISSDEVSFDKAVVSFPAFKQMGKFKIDNNSKLYKILFFLATKVILTRPEDCQIPKIVSSKIWPYLYRLLTEDITFKPYSFMFYRMDNVFSPENNPFIGKVETREPIEKEYFVNCLGYRQSDVLLNVEQEKERKSLGGCNQNILMVLTWRKYFENFQKGFSSSLYFKDIVSFLDNEEV